MKMGSGAVETAVSAEALLARFPCERGFSPGPVGMIGDSYAAGDWLRMAEVVPHQKGAWTAGGFSLSEKARFNFDESAVTGVKLPDLLLAAERVTVASGELFVASSSHRAELQRTTGAQAVDMNLFGLTTACSNHRLPLACLRIVSDRADDAASADFQKFSAAYDGAGGKAFAELIRNLLPNPQRAEAYPRLRRLLEVEAGP